MPMARYRGEIPRRVRARSLPIFPFDADKKEDREAQDGVSCSVCHQIGKERLGTRESFNGGFVIEPPESRDLHPEYGPFEIEKGNQTIMRTSTGGFRPTEDSPHIRRLCNYAPRVTSFIPKLWDRTEKSSANCLSRCPTSNGSTANIGITRVARTVICRW